MRNSPLLFCSPARRLGRRGIPALLALVCIGASGLFMPAAIAVDYSAERVTEPVPDSVPAAIRELLAPEAVRVQRGSRVACDIWLLKEWAVKSLKPAQGVNYPLTPGQLIGLVRIERKTGDFREQDIAPGIYTLRYAQQPVDGAHVGTSPTRDFLLMVQVEEDGAPELLAYDKLTKESAKAAQTSHPALWSLQPTPGDAEVGSIRHDESKDWWIVRLSGKAVAEGEQAALPLELVVAGHAGE